MNKVEIEGKIIQKQKVTGCDMYTIQFDIKGFCGSNRFDVVDMDNRYSLSVGDVIQAKGKLFSDDYDNPMILAEDIKTV